MSFAVKESGRKVIVFYDGAGHHGRNGRLWASASHDRPQDQPFPRFHL
jgi:hypothetical protein